MEKFVGCNCYYLLEKASDKDWTLVDNTLNEIQQAGFNVVRTWGFNSDPSKGHPLQKTPQAPSNFDLAKTEADQMAALGIDPGALDAFDKLLELAHSKGLKLMICLTNSLADYGGMPQFVRWAGFASNDIPPSTKLSDLTWDQKQELRRQFWGSSSAVPRDAQAHCRNYITFMVTHINKLMHSQGWDCVHSWDICNEPRNPNSSSTAEITTWVADTAALVKGLEKKLQKDGVGKQHLVTVGSEGFWGQADANAKDPLRTNPYGSGAIEGCDWRAEASSSIDFLCIHPYADQWNHWNDALKFNEDWIAGHVAACRQLGKPLVVQEYNLPADIPDASNQRRDYFNFVQTELLKQDSPLVGAMVWMVGDPSYPGDKYMICPGTADWAQQADMCEAVNRPVTS